MQCLILLLLLSIVLVENQSVTEEEKRMICYYDGKSFKRQGLGKLTLNDLEPALQFCTHLIYGYAGIDASTNKLMSINPSLDLDTGNGLYRRVTDLKVKYPHLKILLSIGGDHDIIDPENNKYENILESSLGRITFINGAYSMVKTYNFDGLDLAWQFAKNNQRIRPMTTTTNMELSGNTKEFSTSTMQPLNSESEFKTNSKNIENSATQEYDGYADFWNGFKNIFPAEKKVTKRAILYFDQKADEHREQFTALVRELKNSFRSDGYLLSLSVLPNVNSSVYFDVPLLSNYFDFVNLHAYDFATAERNEMIADFTAPIYELTGRIQEENVNFQVQYWLSNECPANLINVGVAAYGRTWTLTEYSNENGLPPVSKANGVGAAGVQIQIPGMLSWSEVCSMLPNPSNTNLLGADKPLIKVKDVTKRYGSYAYRSADDNGDHGIWVGYEDPDTAANKAAYVRAKGLGGVALVDMSFDDFRGLCTGDKYPILRAMKRRL